MAFHFSPLERGREEGHCRNTGRPDHSTNRVAAKVVPGGDFAPSARFAPLDASPGSSRAMSNVYNMENTVKLIRVRVISYNEINPDRLALAAPANPRNRVFFVAVP